MKKDKSLAIENDQDSAKRARQKKLRHKKHMRFWDRLAGFIIVLVLVVGCSCLGLEYIILKGPSPALREQSFLSSSSVAPPMTGTARIPRIAVEPI